MDNTFLSVSALKPIPRTSAWKPKNISGWSDTTNTWENVKRRS